MARSTSQTTTDHQQAIAYVRVSTSGQAEDGVSLDAQRRKIATRLAEQGMYSRAGSVFAPSAILAMVGQKE